MIVVRLATLFLLFGIVSAPAGAALIEDGEAGGSLKTLNTGYSAPPGTPFKDGFFSVNSQRLELGGKLRKAVRAEFALENQVLYSDPPGQILLPSDSANRRLDLEHDWNRGHHWSNRLAVDRLLIRGSSGNLDWSIGRQAVGFGRIVIFSPLDIVAPFAPDALDTDVRPGIDAVRAIRYFGLGGQIGATAVFGQDSADNSYLLTWTGNRSGIDFLGIGGVLRDRKMAGIGLAGSLGTLGIKAEASHYEGKNVDVPGGDLSASFTIAALELWYRFDNGVVFLCEYLYNGAGASGPDRYLEAVASGPVNEGLTYLLGRQYLMVGPSWDLHPLMTLSGLAIWNLKDDSALLRPQLQWSLADNLSLDLFYAVNIGQAPQQVAPGLALPRSEFGSAGDSGGVLLRWYF